eukprot:sb/3466849/
MPNQLSIVSFSQKNNNKKEECPICYRLVDTSQIEAHADRCADETTAEELQIISSQETVEEGVDEGVDEGEEEEELGEFGDSTPVCSDKEDEEYKPASDLWDADIFSKGTTDDDTTSLPEITEIGSTAPKRNSTAPAPKRNSWNLDNSFGGSTAPPSSKRKKLSSPVRLAPYPEPSKVRGCFKDTGNCPGASVQTLLATSARKGKEPAGSGFSSCSGGGASSGASSSGGFAFKVHPMLAKLSGGGGGSSGGSGVNDAVIPDGEGGFIIRDDAELSDDGGFLPPSLPENGFIDFHNQFKKPCYVQTLLCRQNLATRNQLANL